VIVELRTFGVPSLLCDGAPLRFPSRKGLALLIVLALEGEVRRERVADLLWSEGAGARDALRNCLAQVNKVLVTAGLEAVRATRDHLAWSEARLRVDVRALEAAVRSADVTEHAAVARLARGAWLEGFHLTGASEFEDWAAGRGALHSGQLEGALEQASVALNAESRWIEAIEIAQVRLKLAPLSEGAYRALIHAQRGAKRDLEARATAQAYRTTVQREFGEESTLEDASIHVLDGAWLEGLSEEALRLAQFVAVAQEHASLRFASSVLGTDPVSLATHWARLEALGALQSGALTSDTVRAAVEATIPDALRAAFGAAVLEHLEARVTRGELVSPLALVQFSVAALDVEREALHRLRAGNHAYSIGALEVASQQYEGALALLVAQPLLLTQAHARELYLQLGGVYRALVYTAPNMTSSLSASRGVARSRADLGLEALARAIETDAAFVTHGDALEAERGFAAALELARAARFDAATSLALVLLAWFENNRWNVSLALEHARDALETAVRAGERTLEYAALEAVYMFEQNLGLWSAAREHALRAGLVALEVGHARVGRPYALTMAAFCALNLGQAAQAESDARNALELIGESDWHNGLGFAKRTLALALLECDQATEALEHARSSAEHFAAINNTFGACSSHITVARAHFALGDVQTALNCIDQALSALEGHPNTRAATLMRAYALNLRGQVLHALGNATLEVTLEAIAARGDGAQPGEATSWLLLCPREHELEALWHAGQRDAAREELRGFLALHLDNPRVRVLHRRAEAALHALEGRRAQAVRALETALLEAQDLGLTAQAHVIAARLEALTRTANPQTR
jgi:DNA-binding SARP family transcriptional activator/tetratricopeptide (TPR) repeat protein